MIDSFNFPFLGHKRAFHVSFGLLNEFRKKKIKARHLEIKIEL